MPPSSTTTSSDAQGVVFPLLEGGRSTTATGRAVFVAAARAADEELAAAIEHATEWHTEYVPNVRRLVEAQVRDPGCAVAVAEAGLAAAAARFEFAREGERHPIAAVGELPPLEPIQTVTVSGRGAGAVGQLRVPYRGESLTGDRLHRQLDAWVERGTVEPSFAEAIRLVLANPDWLELSDRTFAVLGAGAEMGPLGALCDWNADVLAVDLRRPQLWQRVIARARAGVGRLHVPVRGAQPGDDDEAIAAAAGTDVVTALPELVAWLSEVEGPLTVGNYVYADGAMHVRATVAVDALVQQLAGRRDDLSLAVLATPTDVYAVPEEVVGESRRRFAERGTGRRLTGRASGGRLFAANYPEDVTTTDGRRFGIADSLVPQQGPNYALAKRLQQWRALVARDRGVPVSINVAPTTGTRSVTKNRILAAAYAGAPRYDVEVFAPETSDTLMAALLVHDLRNPDAPASPQTPLGHPLELLSHAAAHAGLWRQPFAPRSVLPLAVVRGLPRLRR